MKDGPCKPSVFGICWYLIPLRNTRLCGFTFIRSASGRTQGMGKNINNGQTRLLRCSNRLEADIYCFLIETDKMKSVSWEKTSTHKHQIQRHFDSTYKIQRACRSALKQSKLFEETFADHAVLLFGGSLYYFHPIASSTDQCSSLHSCLPIWKDGVWKAKPAHLHVQAPSLRTDRQTAIINMM